MNPVRLAEIEAATYRDVKVIPELIAALRLEWKKRDKYVEETFANLAEVEARAARAEAEVERLKEKLQKAYAGVDIMDVLKKNDAYISSLETVREAAEAL